LIFFNPLDKAKYVGENNDPHIGIRRAKGALYDLNTVDKKVEIT